jgi:hypothetical protein
MGRYVLLSYCMAMRTVSFRVKKRFPDLQHLVDAGLMREDELKVSSHLSLLPRARIFKRLWSPGIDSKALIPPAYVAWRAGTITLFLLCA